jgi:hypothetical protein
MYDINDFDFQKDTIIETPLQLSKFLYNKVKRKGFKQVLDIGSHKGNLSKYFKNVVGLDIEDTYKDNFNDFICKDFLHTTKEDFQNLTIDLIVSNPPFNDLLAFKFMEHAKKIFENIPQIYIVPNYILDNSKTRGEKLKEYNITKIVKLDPHLFKASGVAIHCSLIFLNLNFKDKKAFDYFYLKKEIKGKRRTIYLTQEEEEILKKLKITNFSRFVKDMIIEKSKEKHIPKTTIKLNEKEENKTIISWNEMSIEDKLEVHIKNIMVDIKLKIEEGNKEIAIKNLQYYIKRLPNNYKAIKYENIINEKLNILNKLLEEISI